MSDAADRDYQRQVAASIAARSRESEYVPDAPIELFITRRRQPGSMAELDEIERLQLVRSSPTRSEPRAPSLDAALPPRRCSRR